MRNDQYLLALFFGMMDEGETTRAGRRMRRNRRPAQLMMNCDTRFVKLRESESVKLHVRASQETAAFGPENSVLELSVCKGGKTGPILTDDGNIILVAHLGK